MFSFFYLPVFVKSWWKTILRPQADFSSYITAMLLIAVFEVKEITLIFIVQQTEVVSLLF